MAKAFDPAVLFEVWRPDPRLALYPSLDAVLDAVAAKKKAIFAWGAPLSYLTDGGADFAAIVRGAMRRGLAVTIYDHHRETPPRNRAEPAVYVLPLDQTWRIAALDALREATRGHRWSFVAEEHESLLLGYTAAQRKRWIEAYKNDKASFGVNTLYTLLTTEQRRRVLALGRRALGSAEELVGRRLFFHPSRALRKSATRLIPKGTTLARVGYEWAATQRLFGSLRARGKKPLDAKVTAALAQDVADSIRTNVELLGARGWK